jgi:beta-phosphoglucomutase-like phosphatase (HAD superfamily)
MCDKCVEIDKKAERYRSIASRTTDQPVLDGIKELIQQLEEQKLALHPKEE